MRYASLQYQRSRFPIAIAGIDSLLAAAALSWLKPMLGTRGLVGIALGTAVLVAGFAAMLLRSPGTEFVVLDGETFMSWEGDINQLSPDAGAKFESPLWISTDTTEYEIHSASLQEIATVK